jgi:two-component system sensor histidine kinase KdpD
LASIKDSVSSLRQPDVQWSEADVAEFLETIEDATDRLDWLVGNILDMSRLQAGAVSLSLSSVGLDEIVPRALRTLPEGRDKIEIDVPESLSRVKADPAMLERALANILDNALAWSPAKTPVRAQASEAAGRVELRVVDRGPGIPEGDREKMLQPFQRLGDRPREGGVGLGLAVARGLVEAMDGKIDFEDTPGGGLTVVISLVEAA